MEKIKIWVAFGIELGGIGIVIQNSQSRIAVKDDSKLLYRSVKLSRTGSVKFSHLVEAL